MKKFFSIVALSAMTLSLSSFSVLDSSSFYNSDCVREARTLTSMESEALGYDSPNDNWELMSEVYMHHYTNCLN